MKKKRKINLLSVFCVLLCLIGLGVMLYPTANDYYLRWEAVREIEKYNEVVEGMRADYSEIWAAAEEYNRLLAEGNEFTVSVSPEYREYISQFLNVQGTGMMGYISIPKINIYLPIYQGTQESALQAGVGYWIGTSLPTGGPSTHCVLTAHTGLVKAKMFTDLDQMETGDTFQLTVLDRVLTYQVDQILVVEPDDFEPLEIVQGEDYVTLYTCTPYGINTHRLLVRGTRIPTPVDSTPLAAEVQASLMMPILIAVLVLILLLAIFLFRRKRKEKKETAE